MRGVALPLRVAAPSSPLLGAWRPPLWGRLSFALFGIAILGVGGVDVLTDPQPSGQSAAIVVLVGGSLVVLPWRPLLRLHADAVHVRGLFLSQVIPIQEILRVEPGQDGLDVWWGDDCCTTVSFVGELGLLGALLGLGGKAHGMAEAIMEARDEYLRSHGLEPRSSPPLEP